MTICCNAHSSERTAGKKASPVNPWVAMVVFAALITGVGLAMIALSHWIGPRRTRSRAGQVLDTKLGSYECGITPQTDTRERFSVRFYVVAILFILFDIETVFLIPWALARTTNWMWFGEMAAFVGVLGLGLAYVWQRGVLEWE